MPNKNTNFLQIYQSANKGPLVVPFLKFLMAKGVTIEGINIGCKKPKNHQRFYKLKNEYKGNAPRSHDWDELFAAFPRYAMDFLEINPYEPVGAFLERFAISLGKALVAEQKKKSK